MKLNAEKRKVIHFEKSNSKSVYCMKDAAGNESDTEEINLQRDLSVVIGNDLTSVQEAKNFP